MIYTIQTLKHKYKNYSNVKQKISQEVKNNNLIRIKRGLFTDDLYKDAPVIANVCYEPSYISFEYALSYYGLIPEVVSVYTSAVFNKKNNKIYHVNNVVFEYKSIPNEVFAYGIDFFKSEGGIRYKIASKEKALCDMLYSKYPIRSITDLKVMLYDDLRIDDDELMKLDLKFIKEIAPYYHSNTLLTFVKYLNEVKLNGR